MFEDLVVNLWQAWGFKTKRLFVYLYFSFSDMKRSVKWECIVLIKACGRTKSHLPKIRTTTIYNEKGKLEYM